MNPQEPTSSIDIPDELTDTGIQSLDSKLAMLDDDLNPIDPANDPLAPKAKPVKETEEDTPEEDESDDEEVDDDATREEKPKKDEKSGAKKPNTDEEEGYTLDEEDTDKLATQGTDGKVTEPQAVVPQDQYILEGIKNSAITVRGTIGDSAEVQEFKVLMPEQLPQGFRYIDSREQSIADKAYMMIEQEARRLQQEYTTQQSQGATNDFMRRENITDRREATILQKDGIIPQFKKNPDLPVSFDTSNFRNVINLLADNKDEAAVLIKDVMDFKDAQNIRYGREYQAGLSYKHIGFDEAFKMYQKSNPTAGNPAQVREDKARHAFAKRTAKAGSGAIVKTPKAGVRQGMTSRELDDYIESLDI